MMILKMCVLLWLSLTLVFSSFAQNIPVPIAADNIHEFRSVAHYAFADWEPQVGKIENGWFATNRDASNLALMNRNGEIVVTNDKGGILDHYAVPGNDGLPATVLDLSFRQNEAEVVSTHAEGGAYFAAYRNYDTHSTTFFRFDTADVPLRIWDSGLTWLEVSPADYLRSRYVQRLTPVQSSKIRTNEKLSPDEVFEMPSGPESDPDSFLRIGRIEPPFAITVTQKFLVKRWNMETGEVTASAQLDALPGAGQLTPDGRYFGWRDGDSIALHLLDFEIGKDRVIAELRGTYVPFLLLNSSANVMIGVNVALKPVVVAWNTVTGEKVELGEYRYCNRQPDMVRLSQDDTTVVIGCDKGLDFWQISTQD